VSLALFSLLCLSAAPPPGQAGRVLDEVVAVVRSPSGETRLVTLSKLREEARVALVSRGAPDAAVAPLDGPALEAALEWIVDQILIADEVNRLRVFEVDRAEVLAELKRFRERFRRPEDYRAFLEASEITEEELMAVLRRMLRVQRYLDNRVMRTSRVPESEARAYYQEHRKDFDGLEYERAREAVRAHLIEERVKAEVKSVLADLRGRSEIRVLVSFSPGK
jgi:muconolactone delta-isomerase